MDWGFELFVDFNYIIYVWFDVLLGYVIVFLDFDSELILENVLLKWWLINLYLIGKDILCFYVVYWLVMLMLVDLFLFECVFGYGFLIKDGKKMGKF